MQLISVRRYPMNGMRTGTVIIVANEGSRIELPDHTMLENSAFGPLLATMIRKGEYSRRNSTELVSGNLSVIVRLYLSTFCAARAHIVRRSTEVGMLHDQVTQSKSQCNGVSRNTTREHIYIYI